MRQRWKAVGQGIKKLKEVSMLEWIYYVSLENQPGNYIPWKGPENIPFTKVIRKVPVRGVPRITNKFSSCSPLYTRLMVGDANIELDSLIAMGILGWPQLPYTHNGGQMAKLNHQKPGRCNYYNERQGQGVRRGSLRIIQMVCLQPLQN